MARRRAVWEGAFLEALAACGTVTVTVAARAAGVDRTSVYGARRRDEGFAGRWRAALAEGRARIGRGEVPALAQGEVLRASRHGRPCVMRAGAGRWSAAKEATFLAVLADTANVRAAAAAAAISTTALYRRRAQWPAFAEAWGAAVRTGYLDVELLLIRNAKDVLDDAPRPKAGRRGRRLKDDMTVAEAIHIVKLHRASVKGGAAQRYGWRAAEPDIEEVRAEVLRKVAAMERAGLV